MTRTAIILRASGFALGAFVSLHQPARAGLIPTLETATSAAANWTYTIGGPGHPYNFGAIKGTDPLGGSNTADTTVAPPDGSPPGSPPSGSPPGGSPPGGSALSIPEPGTLALIGLPLLIIATMVRRRP